MVGDGAELSAWESNFENVPAFLTTDERKEWLSRLRNVGLSSDAFFPFSDNIHRAYRSGVSFIIAPSGSVQDAEVIKAADDYDMTYVHTSLRLFHH